ncbi:hypothetical protein Syun_016675 [Stephania yunnanensis]|uniref:TLD domain-containing protein 1 n=1 Tax=Stephania yunnanensis TaxID=152371 RepID=A0AAP0J7S5_9MAGN
MGNAQSPSKDPRFLTACRAFTEKEIEDLKRLHRILAHQSQCNAQFISGYVFVAIYERGTPDEIEEFIYQLLDVTGDGIVNRSDLEAVLSGVYDAVFSQINAEDGLHWQLWRKNFIAIFVDAATFSKKVEGYAESGMSFEEYKRWCSHVPSVRKFLGSLMMTPDPASTSNLGAFVCGISSIEAFVVGSALEIDQPSERYIATEANKTINHAARPGFQVPHLLHSENKTADFPLLRREYAWHIGGALPLHELDEWKLLYHSAVHGLSFNTFLGNISNEEVPTVLIIKDKEGYIYGGYASQPWEKHGDFYGDMKCFLFQLFPVASIYRPTGANANLQWVMCGEFTSENIPNGLGFGGRANHFGLFLSASFDQGHTMACTTFGSPELSKSHKIIPEVIECWGVVSKEGQLGNFENLKGTALERFKEDRNLLNLMGIAANSSE